ncbi:copper chaperone PCu(A)C [Actibacterium pelagium]|uniref:Copper chaperone PCu(A)C n=1 Tax=Actibacterium pelagium TaxID=2029103 RepID=A0A917EIN9_9RHOB|nr:copper chaperone PCu(A)C [Actibacterium pelagium]GGE47501.1 hypothetical protein GCM10011517_14120 [Actibacterium pelagium]
MFNSKTLLTAGAVTLFALPAFAEGIMINDAYARSSSPKAGAAFMVIENTGPEGDRLIAAASDVAMRVELHTHKIDANGVAKMMEVEEGFPIAAGESHALARGGDHVMFMGLKEPFKNGEVLTVTLTFEKAGDMTIEIPVDLDRKPMGGPLGHNAQSMKN